MSDIFISYASEDRNIALKYFEAFRQLGFDVWWDYENMNAGGMVHRAISQALDDASCIVVLWSKHSIDSSWVNDEAHVGKGDEKLVPIIIDESISKREIPALLRIIHSADLSKWDGDLEYSRFKKLIKDIKTITPPSLLPKQEKPSAPVTAAVPQPQPAVTPTTPVAQIKQPVQPQPETPPIPDPVKTQPIQPAPAVQANAVDTPYLLLFLLPLLTVVIKMGGFRFEFLLYVIPVAAWLGSSYGKSGIKVAAIGFVPLLYGSSFLDGFSLPLQTGLYLAAVLVSYACAYPNRFWSHIETFNLTIPAIAGVLILGTAFFGIKGEFGLIGIKLDIYLLYTVVFVIGLIGRHIKAAIIISMILGFAGTWLRSFPLTKFSEDLGSGMKVIGGYFFDSIPEVVTVIIILLCGNLIGKALRSEKITPALRGASGYLLFIACWIYAIFTFKTSKYMVYSGSPLLLLVMAFMAGMVWQKKAKYLLAGVIVFGVFCAILQVPYFKNIAYIFNYYLAAIVFYIFGLKLSIKLGLQPGLVRSYAGMTSALFAVIPVSRKPSVASADSELPWLIILLLPLFTLTLQFSKRTGFSLMYFIVPVAAWLAYRYGKKIFVPMCLTMVIYWLGYKFNHHSFKLHPDMYMLAVIVAWAILNPAAWLKKLDSLQHSNFLVLMLILLVPIMFYFRVGPMSIGWDPRYFYPFVLFVIGWAGVRQRFALTVIIVSGIGGILLYRNGFRIRSADITMYHMQVTLIKVLAGVLWYEAGRVVNRFFALYNGQPDAAWPAGDQRFYAKAHQPTSADRLIESVTSRKGYYILATLMALAMFGFKFKLGGFAFKPLGNTWLLFLGAFMAGFIWRQLGYQLTLFGYAVGWLLSGAIMASAGGSIKFDEVDQYWAFFSGRHTFLVTGLAVFLYCHLGVKLSQALTKAP